MAKLSLLCILVFIITRATLGYPQNTFKNDGGQQKQENSEYGGQYVMQQPQYNPYHYGQYGNYYYPNMYWRPSYQYQRPRPQPVQQGGCSGSATCASACLQNQNWYGTWYYPTPKPEEAEEDSTTKPNYNQNQFAGCQYSDCAYNAGYYGSSCGLRPMLNYGNSPCGATNGWPQSYCGSSNQEWSYVPYCDSNLCTADCQSYGQDGGYCDTGKCSCFKRIFKNNNVADNDNSPASSSP